MRKLQSSDILPLIYNYLLEIGLPKIAKKLSKESGIDLTIQNKKTLSSKKLDKVCKYFIENNAKLLKYYAEEIEKESEINEIVEEKIVETKKLRKNSKKIEEVEEIISSKKETKPKRKNSKKTNEDDKPTPKIIPEKSPELKRTRKNSKKIEEEEKKEEIEEEYQEDEEYNNENGLNDNSKKINKNFFKRIDHSRLHQLKDELKDNTFMAKFKYGQGGDEFGKIGHEKLKDTRGRSFKKEKTKLKNKNFQGGGFKIDIHARNSIKL